MYYFSEFFKYFKFAKTSTILLLSVITISMLLTISALGLVLVSDKIESRINDAFAIDLYLRDIDESELSNLKENLSLDNKILESVYTDKKKAEEKFIRETGMDFRSVLKFNPLPDMITLKIKPRFIKAESLFELKKEYQKYSAVDEVILRNDDLVLLFSRIRSVRSIIWTIAALISLTAIGFLFLLNKNLIIQRQREFSIMKLVGCSKKVLIVPLFLYNLAIGLFSSGIVILIIRLFNILLNKIGFGIRFDVLNTIHYLIILSGGAILPVILLLFRKHFSNDILMEN